MFILSFKDHRFKSKRCESSPLSSRLTGVVNLEKPRLPNINIHTNIPEVDKLCHTVIWSPALGSDKAIL